jgi:acylphosphatase
VIGGLARLEASVRGRVQGVGYRYFVLSEAGRLGLTGWVSNEQDGSVYCVAEGPRGDLQILLEALKEGPAMAIVEHVAETWLPYTGHWSSFGVRSAGHRGD